MGARLEWALLNYFVDEHLKDGYEFILPPYQLGYNCGFGAGQFPKFSDEVYWLDCDEDRKRNRFMLPTAETALVNMYAGEIIDESKLPMKFFAYSPCFRKEAGSARAEERGMIRGHQFNKIEMVQYAHPDHSKEAFEELVNKAARLVEGLGLHFRVSKLAAGDCSASMARTYDVELWIPSMGIYKECSSVSNANDYQARRNNTRFRDSKTGKPQYVHTLNGSGLATSRLIPAIVEQFQTKTAPSPSPKCCASIWAAWKNHKIIRVSRMRVLRLACPHFCITYLIKSKIGENYERRAEKIRRRRIRNGQIRRKRNRS